MCILVLNDFIQAEKTEKAMQNHHFSYQSFTISNTYFSIHIPREKGDQASPYQCHTNPFQKAQYDFFSPSPPLKMKVRLMTQLTKKSGTENLKDIYTRGTYYFYRFFFYSLKSKYTTCFIVWKIGGFCDMSVSERKKK